MLKYSNIKIGADPEVIFETEDGELIFARDYFRQGIAVGCDGNDDIGELRIGVHKTPMEAVAAVSSLLSYINEELPPSIIVRAGSYVHDLAIGGHIHISPIYKNEFIEDNLEFLIGSFEEEIYSKGLILKRRNQGYGLKFETKDKPYGIEFRRPVSWLTAPSITLIYFSLAKIAVNSYINNIHLVSLVGDVPTKKLLNNLKDFIKVPKDCEEGIKLIPEILKHKEGDWDKDILVNWNIRRKNKCVE